jgi:UDP-2,3-diacylglucosamine pyrophosphatase LpxH
MKKALATIALTFLLATTILATSCSATTAVIVPATNPTANPLWDEGSTRNKIVCISDLHLGVNDKISQDTVNRPYLIDFINRAGQTKSIRELVIAGDFLDEWILPLNYPVSTDSQEYYKQCIANNKGVIDALKGLSNTGVKLVYVSGNHDMTLLADTLIQAMPNINFVGNDGIGVYITGDNKEIAIEHGNRYDVYSAPDTVDNKGLTSSPILPPGYFYARLGTSWFLQGSPIINKMIPELAEAPAKTNVDQYGAYIYSAFWYNNMNTFTNIERFDDKVFNLKNYGFNTKLSEADILPVLQSDGTITTPALFKDFQKSWEQIQTNNGVRVHSSFIEAASAQLNPDINYFPKQESIQYDDQGIQTVVFGHTHAPLVQKFKNGITVLNDGSWVDTRTGNQNLTRTFAVITTGKTDFYDLYQYKDDGSLAKVTTQLTLPAAN